MKKAALIILVISLLLGAFTGCINIKVYYTETTDTASGTTPVTEPYDDPPGPEHDQPTPAMWRVADGDGDTVLYLFGTIHVGDARSTAAMERVAPFLSECGALAVEFDTVAYQKDYSQMQRDVAMFVCTDGTTIKDHLPPDLYDRAVQLLKDRNMYSDLLDYYNAAMWAQFIDQALIENHVTLDTKHSMDEKLIKYAYSAGIDVLAVESATFQYSLMNSFSDELYALMIRQSLDAKDEANETLDKMYSAWLDGDVDAIADLMFGEYDDTELTEREIALYEEYEKAFIDDRNLGMAQKALGYIESGRTVFFAVGTGHMLAENGLVALLTGCGYSVERMEY